MSISNDSRGRSLTIPEFCEQERISDSTFYKLRRAGFGPAELRLPGTEVVRITPAAIAEWRERMIKLGKTKQAELSDNGARRNGARPEQLPRRSAAAGRLRDRGPRL
jgi:hypothetical protein